MRQLSLHILLLCCERTGKKKKRRAGHNFYPTWLDWTWRSECNLTYEKQNFWKKSFLQVKFTTNHYLMIDQCYAKSSWTIICNLFYFINLEIQRQIFRLGLDFILQIWLNCDPTKSWIWHMYFGEKICILWPQRKNSSPWLSMFY